MKLEWDSRDKFHGQVRTLPDATDTGARSIKPGLKAESFSGRIDAGLRGADQRVLGIWKG